MGRVGESGGASDVAALTARPTQRAGVGGPAHLVLTPGAASGRLGSHNVAENGA